MHTDAEAPPLRHLRIRAGEGGLAGSLRELWEYRDLLYFIMWRDVKVRYKQTVLGAAWAILQPLFSMLIFTVLFGMLARLPSDGIPYPLFYYAGLMPWTFFQNAVTNSGNSLIESANLLTKVYFPRVLIPAATVAAGLVDFAFAFVVLAGLLLYYQVPLTWTILLLPLLIALTTAIALGVGMWMAAANVKYRDIRHALPFLMQLWFFLTPIVYSPALIREKWRPLVWLNPIAGIIDGYRAVLVGRAPNTQALLISAGVTAILFISAAHVFRRMEKTFADVI